MPFNDASSYYAWLAGEQDDEVSNAKTNEIVVKLKYTASELEKMTTEELERQINVAYVRALRNLKRAKRRWQKQNHHKNLSRKI